MTNKEKMYAVFQELRINNIRKQKKGLSFIMASVFLWAGISAIHLSSLPIITKNLYTFFCSIPVFPLAYFISKLIGADLQDKENPPTKLSILLALNQLLYIVIAMWVYSALPEKMLMAYTIIFGAHLLPYGWLYQSKSYYIFSIFIPLSALLAGLYGSTAAIAVLMFFVMIIFCLCLLKETLYTS